MKTLVPLLLLALIVCTAGCDLMGISVTTPAEPPVISSFEASPANITAGESATLEWNVSGATKVSIDPDIGSVALSGSRVVMPEATTVYTLTAGNASGTTATATAQVIVTEEPSPPASLPVVNSFTASPPNISTGGSATLSWNVSNATSVTIEPGLGTFATSGSTIVSPIATTNYILTAANAAGSITDTAQVVVLATSPPAGAPVVNYFTANPPSITAGGSTTLSWSVSNATSVTIDHGVGVVASSGTKSVSPAATTNYTLTASNTAGWYSLTISVPVTESPPPITEKPDLVVMTINKLTGTGGYVIGYTIRNQGDAPCPATVTKLYVNGVYKTSDSVPALAAGTSVDRQFTAWTYDPATPVLRVVADANSAVAEANEGNNEKAVSIAVEVIVNFIDRANVAEWKTSSPATDISFGGATSDPNGFACYRTSIKMEDGHTYAKVLETHPKWVNNGSIYGYYPEVTIPLGAKFIAKVGFLDGAAGTDGVQFRVWFWPSGVDIPSVLGYVDATYDGELDSFNISLASLVGYTGRIGLQVVAGPSSGKDWAAWVDAKMVR